MSARSDAAAEPFVLKTQRPRPHAVRRVVLSWAQNVLILGLLVARARRGRSPVPAYLYAGLTAATFLIWIGLRIALTRPSPHSGMYDARAEVVVPPEIVQQVRGATTDEDRLRVLGQLHSDLDLGYMDALLAMARIRDLPA